MVYISVRKNLISALYLVFQPLLLNLVGLFATAYILRVLGPDGFGQWATAATIVAVTGFLTSLGLRPQFVRSVAQNPEKTAEYLAHQLGMRLAFTLVAIALSIIACLLLDYGSVVLVCTCISALTLLLTTVNTTLSDLLQGLEQIQSSVLIGLISGIALIAATVTAMRLGTGPAGLSAAYAVGPLISTGLLYRRVHKTGINVRLSLDMDRVRYLMKESGAWTLTSFVNVLRDRAEQLILPKLAGLTAMGYFASGSLLADRLLLVPDGLSTAFFTSMTRQYQDSGCRHGRAPGRLILLSLTLCLALAVLLMGLAQPVACLLFPESSDTIASIIRITAMALPFAGIGYPVTFALVAAGKQVEAARAGVPAAVISIVASFLLVGLGGLPGACWSYVIRFAVPLLFLLPAFVSVYPGILPGLPIARLLFSAAVMAVLLWTCLLVPAKPMYAAYLSGAASLAVYSVMLLLLGVLDRAELRSLLTRDANARD